ncbi:MAG: response regulator transcription factor [Caldilineaceae bacterium]|nr:response regulator transcription factor [Caldilineaceae bacterium]
MDKSSRLIRIILADDHALVIEGLRSLIDQQRDMSVVATVEDGDQLLNFLEAANEDPSKPQVDVVVLDLQMPFSGLRALEELRKRGDSVRVLILTAFADGERIRAALELGADGFALKTESPTQTIDAIRQVAQGRLVFPRIARRWMTHQQNHTIALSPQLSPRELEVLAQLSEGLPNQEIGSVLSVSENTVRFHLKNIYEKLQVSNRTEAAAWYFKTYKKNI